MQFKTDISDALVIGQPKDEDYESSIITVEWEVEFEVRTWGLKCANISITKVTGELEDSEADKLVDLSDYEIVNGLDIEDDGKCCPSSIIIEMDKKKIEIA
jgi:hypothetical protein